ncbi:MAG: hypothetical protein GXP63_01535 [DPANN group archaeon]|nr:hypothetical protein [DPANN group archaeon]
MTVKSITAAILNEAKQEAQELLDATRRDAEKLIAERKEALAKEREEKEAAYRKAAEKVYGTEMVKASFILRNEELTSRQKLLEQAHALALDRLRKQSKEEQKQLLRSLLKQAASQMQVFTVYVNSADKSLIPPKYKVKTTDIKGGLIAETKEGDVRIDLSYESLLADIMETKLESFSAALEG